LDINLALLATTLDQNLYGYVGHDVELVPSPVASAVTQATRMTSLQVPTLDALTRPCDTKGHLQRGISRITRTRDFSRSLRLMWSFTHGLYSCCFGNRLWGVGYVFLLRISIASMLPLIVILWRHIGYSASRRATLLMS
jgi:hypothetical protein